MSRTLEVDRLARELPNRVAIFAGGMGDPGEAQDIVRDIAAVLESDYELRLRVEDSPHGRPSEGRFVGRLITSKFSARCAVCEAPIAQGAGCIWRRGEGVACIVCGTPEDARS